MATIDLAHDTFESAIGEHDILLVDWWAGWCGPCRQFAPVYEAASDQHDDVTFASIDTEAQQELAGAAGISSIPTLMAFREGMLVFSQAGALPAPALEELITAVKALDMEEVRRKAPQEKGQQQ